MGELNEKEKRCCLIIVTNQESAMLVTVFELPSCFITLSHNQNGQKTLALGNKAYSDVCFCCELHWKVNPFVVAFAFVL